MPPPASPRPRRSLAARAWLTVATALAGCGHLVDPPLPNGAVRFTPPPVYARWWAMTEACSGLRGDPAAVAWYVTAGARTISDGQHDGLSGYYVAATHRIVLADTAGVVASDIRHEMLHALARRPGHARAQFVDACGGTVSCIGACVSDAGPAPPPDPAAAPVPVTALRAAAEVTPVAPGRSVDGGLFSYTLLVTNPRATPVVVALQPSGDVGPPVRASWRYARRCDVPGRGVVDCDTGYRDERVTDLASATRFGPGETKRVVTDFVVTTRRDEPRYFAVEPGTYVFRGSYGGYGIGNGGPTGGSEPPAVPVVLSP